ncbi:uncharacterized protein BBOV_IV000780 [Babesia bovis T2Bo]|uniref:Uncharacterized protein n=1 Tax=Babesia bovis TaxID=5865 RepID=A7AV50_BABBO|nr:uncharacterized protein BBOV_IV000780 [Babesia bovis T2Bo]EDO05676.1 hypothetical protein BBOV_IV000780 [Babesia bovis T2Bo]|eukprot:XP_001609244.1 hypothetical protein [Babesia bovis T2Bo]
MAGSKIAKLAVGVAALAGAISNAVVADNQGVVDFEEIGFIEDFDLSSEEPKAAPVVPGDYVYSTEEDGDEVEDEDMVFPEAKRYLRIRDTKLPTEESHLPEEIRDMTFNHLPREYIRDTGIDRLKAVIRTIAQYTPTAVELLPYVAYCNSLKEREDFEFPSSIIYSMGRLNSGKMYTGLALALARHIAQRLIAEEYPEKPKTFVLRMKRNDDLAMLTRYITEAILSLKNFP